MTNLIFAVHKPEGQHRDVLVRVYGEGTESFFSRLEETRLFQLLSDQEIGVELLGQFANGRAEKLIHGSTYTNKRFRQPDESRIIARQLRVFHELSIDIDRTPTYISSIRKLLDVARGKCRGDKFKGIVDFQQLTKDVHELEKILAQVPSPIVLSHNDLQYGNIMKNDAGDAVFIDFEYTSYNPRGYDIGNHFCEWAYDYHKTVNAHLGDFTKYPTEQEQRNFCRAYFAGKDGDENDVSANEMENLRLEANTYSRAFCPVSSKFIPLKSPSPSKKSRQTITTRSLSSYRRLTALCMTETVSPDLRRLVMRNFSAKVLSGSSTPSKFTRASWR